MSKIERLAGMPGTPEIQTPPIQGIGDSFFYVAQLIRKPDTAAQLYGPVRKTEQAAIRAWNAMVQRIRKANAGGLIDD